MQVMPPGLRVGVYVDVENISRNGGRGMRFDVLRKFACRQGGTPIRLNAYLAFDEDRAVRDLQYRERENRYQSAVRDFGFKVFRKPVQWYENEDDQRVSKANTDLDMAVDMLLQSGRLDRLVLATGDGDFTKVVRALQNKGCRVEVVAFKNVSLELRREADFYISGYLIPGLQPTHLIEGNSREWGAIGSRVRGVCYHYDIERQFGFLRYLEDCEGDLTETDTRVERSPYGSAFFHHSELPTDFDSRGLPSRSALFEFTLEEGRKPGEVAATELVVAHRY